MKKNEDILCFEEDSMIIFNVEQQTYFQQFENNPFEKNKAYQDEDFVALKKAKKKDFAFISTLGKGAFGTVFLAKMKNADEKNKNNVYAIKSFFKHEMIKKKQIEMVLEEVENMQ